MVCFPLTATGSVAIGARFGFNINATDPTVCSKISWRTGSEGTDSSTR